jgi:DNA replication protein DnaC
MVLYPLKESDSRELLEIVENRHKRDSTIFCSQFDVGGWHQKIGEPTLADAVCDRIVHDSYTIVIHGEHSMRKRKGISDNPDVQ